MSNLNQSDWQIDHDADVAAAYAALAGDRPWTGYVIADLEPPFRAFSRLALAARKGSAPSAACLVLRHPDFTAVVPHGDPNGVAALLAAIDLPETASLSFREEHRAAVERWYNASHGWAHMRRMHLTAESFRPPQRQAPHLERLDTNDLDVLLDLYTRYPENAFTADGLKTGVFHGVHEGGRLVAAGGTHVVSRRYGVAAVGNIFTLPETRGRGYATAITAAVTADLLALPCRDIILNVDVTNTAASSIYTALGFREHCLYWEGNAVRRP
jgi:ribosomal protein S18 acetylase RimI-like enzyme